MTSPAPEAPSGHVSSADMRLDTSAQALALLLFLSAGLALGLLYDILRPVRHMGGSDAVWDILFCASAALLCFVLSMRSYMARLGTWELCAALCGFCLYIRIFSPFILPILESIGNSCVSLIMSLKTVILKSRKGLKKFFSKISACIKIEKKENIRQ